MKTLFIIINLALSLFILLFLGYSIKTRNVNQRLEKIIQLYPGTIQYYTDSTNSLIIKCKEDVSKLSIELEAKQSAIDGK